MKMKNWWFVVAACLLLIVVYKAGYKAGENSAESKLREKEFAFQKQKEATRLRICEEEKRAKEKRRREEKSEEREKETVKMLMESRDRQSAIIMKTMKDLQKIGSSKRGGISSKSSEKGPQSSVGLSAAVVGRWQLFETTTIDGWVKKVKRGTIFKTTSGNIYEVAEPVILFELELRPDVTVLTDGQFYKLFIRGVGQELLCKKLNSGNKGPITGGTVIEATIIGVYNDLLDISEYAFSGLKHGNIYKLNNGQIWEQTDFYIYIYIAVMPKVTIWQDGSVYKMKVDGIDEVVTVKQIN